VYGVAVSDFSVTSMSNISPNLLHVRCAIFS
jgi:hypothetical protein